MSATKQLLEDEHNWYLDSNRPYIHWAEQEYEAEEKARHKKEQKKKASRIHKKRNLGS